MQHSRLTNPWNHLPVAIFVALTLIIGSAGSGIAEHYAEHSTKSTHEDVSHAKSEVQKQDVVVHLSHFTDDLHATFMAFKIATALQIKDASVTIFLDLEGARLAHNHNNLSVRWGDSETTLAQLFDPFIAAGGKMVVCPHCAHHVGVTATSLRKGVEIGTEDSIAKLFLDADKVIDY